MVGGPVNLLHYGSNFLYYGSIFAHYKTTSVIAGATVFTPGATSFITPFSTLKEQFSSLRQHLSLLLDQLSPHNTGTTLLTVQKQLSLLRKQCSLCHRTAFLALQHLSSIPQPLSLLWGEFFIMQQPFLLQGQHAIRGNFLLGAAVFIMGACFPYYLQEKDSPL